MTEPTQPPIIGLIAVAVAILGPMAGPYAVIVLSALALLWLLSGYRRPADKLAFWALLLYAFHEASVVLCATWFIFAPWPILQGQAMCSAKIGFDLGALGLLLVAVLALQHRRAR